MLTRHNLGRPVPNGREQRLRLRGRLARCLLSLKRGERQGRAEVGQAAMFGSSKWRGIAPGPGACCPACPGPPMRPESTAQPIGAAAAPAERPGRGEKRGLSQWGRRLPRLPTEARSCLVDKAVLCP